MRGEPTLLALLSDRGQRLRYFRHPFLHVGRELDKRRAFEAFLVRRGYAVAPVTIDNDEYIYAAVYASARRRGDVATASRIGADFVRYMETVFAFSEEVSRRVVGREIRQILLLQVLSLLPNPPRAPFVSYRAFTAGRASPATGVRRSWTSILARARRPGA